MSPRRSTGRHIPKQCLRCYVGSLPPHHPHRQERPATLYCVPTTIAGKRLPELLHRQPGGHHECENVVIVSDLNQHMVIRAFIELTVVQGLHNHVDSPLDPPSLDPVVIDLPGDCVQCRPLDCIGNSDHHAVFSIVNPAPARNEDHQQVIWIWNRADWAAVRLA